MPITKAAKKAIRTSLRRKVINDRRKKAMKSAEKAVEKLVKEKKLKETKAALAAAYKAIDKAAKGNIVSKNTAARKKSRLARLTKV